MSRDGVWRGSLHNRLSLVASHSAGNQIQPYDSWRSVLTSDAMNIDPASACSKHLVQLVEAIDRNVIRNQSQVDNRSISYLSESPTERRDDAWRFAHVEYVGHAQLAKICGAVGRQKGPEKYPLGDGADLMLQRHFMLSKTFRDARSRLLRLRPIPPLDASRIASVLVPAMRPLRGFFAAILAFVTAVLGDKLRYQ
jgi:hypothetical protein